MNSFLVNEKSHGRDSRAFEAMRRLEGEIYLETNGADKSGLYGHTVVIQTGGVTIHSDNLDCEFEVPFDDDTEANEADIIVYNLSDATIQNIKAGETITITAGYGSDTGVIFSGVIAKPKTYYSNSDKVTEIYAIDRAQLKEREIQSISYAAKTPASRVLGDLVHMVGIPVAVFTTKRDHIYKDKATVDGGLMENIKKYARVCGVSAYICKGQIYVRPMVDGDGLEFSLSSETGLVSLSEFEEDSTTEEFKDTVHGYEITMLLQHRVTTASLIKVRSKNVTGTYRVREGMHTYDGTNFLTKVKAIDCPLPAPADAMEQKPEGLPDLSGYKGISIVDGLKSVGTDSGFTYRKGLAEKLGIQGYSGTAAQNLEILRKLGAKVG